MRKSQRQEHQQQPLRDAIIQAATAVDWHPDGILVVIAEFDGRIAVQDASLLPGFVPPES